ncbi:MAG: competence protein ComEA [Verrucomicrobiaceae bacterium]|nr:competence protein ComEA [Verrucomicrobiaceae bacterium]
MELKASLKLAFLAAALIAGSVPAWSATPKETAPAATPKSVNINTADAATISDVLKGVGPAKADAIVAYRKEHGPFKTAEQLSDVKGIGEKLVLANHDRIVVK